MNRGWLLSAGLLPLIFCTADASAASVSHVVCSKGFCRTVDDCPAGWSEINISGKYLTDSYKYDCTQTFSRSSPVPSDVAATLPGAPQVQPAASGYSLRYTLAFEVSEPLSCPQLVVNYTPGAKPPTALAAPQISPPLVQSSEAGSYDVVFTCTYK
jgi:hypothetical protein